MHADTFTSIVACATAALGLAPQVHAGPVVGVIDAIRYQNDEYYVTGWACQMGQRGPIDVTVSAGAAPPGKFVISGTANLASESAVDRECRDADSGKHRFSVVLPNQLLRTFQQKKLYLHGIAISGNTDNALLAGSGNFTFPQPRWPPDPPTPDFLRGPPTAAFDTSKDSCEETDIPDAPARAFRDYTGTIHLIASHSVTRAGLGPTLETAKHDCRVVYRSRHDANAANFDDYTWLTAFYTVDGKRIAALGHMEYHGWEHRGMCAGKSDTAACWYNAETFNVSEDGGFHFERPQPPANYVLSLPARYQVDQGPEGYSADTGLLKVGNWFYASVYSWAWPPHCGSGQGQHPCLVPDATCPIRTANVFDPASWRGWDGRDFTVVFVDPYRGAVSSPKSHVCTPVPYLDYSNGINYYPASRLFVATLWNQGSGSFGPQGVYFTTSPDFIHWSKPQLAMTRNQMLRREPQGNWSYGYFSLLDPQSSDPSYSTITDAPDLFYVRFDNDHPPYRRVLFRQRINLYFLLQR
jgi:hypothetical protein